MICHKCQVAGYINTEANRAAALGLTESAEAIRVTARSWHQECTDSHDCDCQHVIGQVTRIETREHAEAQAPEGIPAETVIAIPDIDAL